MKNRILLENLDDTRNIALEIKSLITKPVVVALYGELGTGKTEFARFLMRELGIEGNIASPTFTILQVYDLPPSASLDIRAVYHFDLYRIKNVEELEEIGWYDALHGDYLVIAEWALIAENTLPLNTIRLLFELDSDGRRFCTIVNNSIDI
ncbi:MAG: tRNA (adenosine(37)-N6)-threonylcarbamoyltransferase complex ATPase subunit type 1 TsaE [Alphaproteobacteria bacterium]|nr:tRNA (adenosine(37)-N6)-threonylcarbamoyltransferase complex ATPase subunit type 1 TsaE [Alphaproteobacteria bacterium]MCL2505025.1 tRNA (adenosine(37)-N6)-threonylcarbamoyltransferase complex ATPase subunit type 1 TsaE [Alphaproteobacteria bacterium]